MGDNVLESRGKSLAGPGRRDMLTIGVTSAWHDRKGRLCHQETIGTKKV